MEEKNLTAKVICFASAKGGTGKTVLSASFAEFLGTLDKKVLLVDTDASTNGMTLFYLGDLIEKRKLAQKERMTTYGVFEIIPKDEVYGQPTPMRVGTNVDLIPAAYVMTQTGDADTQQFASALNTILDRFGASYDFIFFDAQAGSDPYAKISTSVADEIVAVSEYDPVSIEGLNRLFTLFKEEMPYQKRWVVYNKVLPEFMKDAGKDRTAERILPAIPWDKEVVLAFRDRKLALNTEKGSQHTLAIMRTISALLGSEISKDIEDWKKEKSDLIRTPIKTQAEDVEKEIATFRRALIETEIKLDKLKQRPRTLAIVGMGLIILASLYISAFLELELHLSAPFTLAYAAIIIGVATGSLAPLVEIFRSRTREKTITLTEEIRVLRDKLDESSETASSETPA